MLSSVYMDECARQRVVKDYNKSEFKFTNVENATKKEVKIIHERNYNNDE